MNSKSYKDLVRENMKLNKELRRISLGENNEDHGLYKTPKNQSTTREYRHESLKQI